MDRKLAIAITCLALAACSGENDEQDNVSTRSYKGHEVDVDSNNFVSVYPHTLGTRLDDCQTCHTTSYSEYTCYECHDHTPEQMEDAHVQENIFEFKDCAVCHPTGREGEGEIFRRNYYQGLQAEGGQDNGSVDVSQGTQEGGLVLKIGQANTDE